MTDKPKRKHNPNRRRKFLLMIVLPIIALIVGFMVLSPQIDAWLATDPFTPQCHFEEDRLFAYGRPPQIASINSGQYDIFETYQLPAKEGARWSPNGRYLAYHLNEREIVLQDMSNNEILRTFPYSTSQSQVIMWHWSPNSRYLAYGLTTTDGKTTRHFIDVEQGTMNDLEFDGEENNPTTQYFNALWWSPDSQYVLIISEIDKWILLNMGELTNIELTGFSKNSSRPYWTSDTKFYFVSNKNLQLYDVTLNIVTEIASLPYDDITFVVVHNDHIVRFWTYAFDGTVVYNLKTKSIVEIEGDFLTWDSNLGTILYLDPVNSSIYRKDVNTGNSTIESEDITIYEYRFSNSHQYMLYVSDVIQSDLSPSPGSTSINHTYHVLDLHTGVHKQLFTFEVPNNIFWMQHEEKEYLVIQKWMLEYEGLYLTYLINPATMAKCRIGISDVFLNISIQPQ